MRDMTTNRCVGIRTQVDSRTMKRDKLVTSFVHDETANCTTNTLHFSEQTGARSSFVGTPPVPLPLSQDGPYKM